MILRTPVKTEKHGMLFMLIELIILLTSLVGGLFLYY